MVLTEFLQTDNIREMESNDEEDEPKHDCTKYFCSNQSNELFAAIQEGQLTIWMSGDKGYKGMAEVGKRFEADTGIR